MLTGAVAYVLVHGKPGCAHAMLVTSDGVLGCLGTALVRPRRYHLEPARREVR